MEGGASPSLQTTFPTGRVPVPGYGAFVFVVDKNKCAGLFF